MNSDADNKQILEMLKDIKQQMQTIENKIDDLNKSSTNVEQDCQQMRNHIYFIESTYKIVRTPLNYITNKINNLIHTNRETSELPMIENSTTV
jgi:archaellum component FlaC